MTEVVFLPVSKCEKVSQQELWVMFLYMQHKDHQVKFGKVHDYGAKNMVSIKLSDQEYS